MGLRTQIIVVAGIAFSTVNLFLCLFITHQVKIFELKRFHAQIDKSAYLMRVINTLPLYNVDLETLTMNMETFFDDENMKSLSIRDSEVNIDIHLERQISSGGTDIKKSFVLDHNGLKLGKLTVVYSTGLIEKQIAQFQARMFAVTVFMTLVVTVVLAFLINTITKPVSRLARVVSEADEGNFDNEIEQTGVGEVKILYRNFVRMRDVIKEKKEALAHTNAMLEGEIQKRTIQRGKKMYRYMKGQDVYDTQNLTDEAGKNTSGIVSNMRSFFGKTNIGCAAEDICLLLDQSLELASNTYVREEDFHFDAIRIMKDYAPDLPKVRCRGDELKQVFFNILSNGAHVMAGHADNSCPTFFLRTYGREDQVCIEIRDNGPGMSQNIRRRIFEPFFSTKTHGVTRPSIDPHTLPGMAHGKERFGFGLSVAYFIITENHKGTIEVESAPGEGACFNISLPI
ncbi:MAG: sensor histidine kinase [Desulfobacterales bacterium]|nr:sensor histidine kinase [Desulfobacterales bacterium]